VGAAHTGGVPPAVGRAPSSGGRDSGIQAEGRP
jgi:hypothetical protein